MTNTVDCPPRSGGHSGDSVPRKCPPAPYRTESVGAGTGQGASGQVTARPATVRGVDVKTDPERTEVVVLRRPQDLGWHVAVVVGSFGTEQAALGAARSWREQLGLVEAWWVRREEAARALGVGVKMVDKLRRAGRLRGLHVAATNRAYVHRADLEALVAERASSR